jgi:hypothetical protein
LSLEWYIVESGGDPQASIDTLREPDL